MTSVLDYFVVNSKFEVDAAANRKESSGLVSFNCLDSGQIHSSKFDSQLLENSNLRDDEDSKIYLHIVETTKDKVNKLDTIRNLNFNLFETQEENVGDNMSTVMVKLLEHTEKDIVNDFKTIITKANLLELQEGKRLHITGDVSTALVKMAEKDSREAGSFIEAVENKQTKDNNTSDLVYCIKLFFSQIHSKGWLFFKDLFYQVWYHYWPIIARVYHFAKLFCGKGTHKHN